MIGLRVRSRFVGVGLLVVLLHLSGLEESRAQDAEQVLIGSEAGEVREFEGLPEFRMAWIPAGRFTMGSPASEEGHDDDEAQVEVELTQGFWLGTTEVTQSQWRAVMESEPWKGERLVREGADYPATYVSWEDATSYCERLTEQERRAGRLSAKERYTLPTEAQWEYAYRAGSQSAYYWGDEASKLDDHAWHLGNTENEQYAHAVGVKRANAWGLHDMSGNVWEWCSDWYGEKLSGGADPIGPLTGSGRSYRGGSWFSSYARIFRGAFRFRDGPTFRYFTLGFRVARVPEE